MVQKILLVQIPALLLTTDATGQVVAQRLKFMAPCVWPITLPPIRSVLITGGSGARFWGGGHGVRGVARQR